MRGNRYTRKRYWNARKKAVKSGRSSKYWQQYTNSTQRVQARQALAHTELDEGWDVHVPRLQDWDWPERGWVQNCYSWRTDERNRACPDLTPEEVRRLPGKFKHKWKENKKADPYIPIRVRVLYVDFEKLCAWLLANYCNELFNAVEHEMGYNRHYRARSGHYYFESIRLHPSWIEDSWRLDPDAWSKYTMPPATLIRKWLKRPAVARLVARAAHVLGMWFYTTDQELSVPLEDRE